MIRQSVIITNPTGLHLRPAGIFCNVASRYQCRVTFEYDETTANAKSVLSVLGACIKKAMKLRLYVTAKTKKKRWKQCLRRSMMG